MVELLIINIGLFALAAFVIGFESFLILILYASGLLLLFTSN